MNGAKNYSQVDFLFFNQQKFNTSSLGKEEKMSTEMEQKWNRKIF